MPPNLFKKEKVKRIEKLGLTKALEAMLDYHRDFAISDGEVAKWMPVYVFSAFSQLDFGASVP